MTSAYVVTSSVPKTAHFYGAEFASGAAVHAFPDGAYGMSISGLARSKLFSKCPKVTSSRARSVKKKPPGVAIGPSFPTLIKKNGTTTLAMNYERKSLA